jgi:HEAT repeat protein
MKNASHRMGQLRRPGRARPALVGSRDVQIGPHSQRGNQLGLDAVRMALAIEPDESMYEGIGEDDIPVLEQLLRDDEAWMASRAVWALAHVDTEASLRGLTNAARDARPEVRVSVAASAARMNNIRSSDILLSLLLNDADPGVRKFSVSSVSGANERSIIDKLRAIAEQDPSPTLRVAARDRLEFLRRGSNP